MSATVASTITPDLVMSFEINPGTLPQFLEARSESGPRLKCFEGSVTLVSPGKSHETIGRRLDHLIMAVCLELGIDYEALASMTWTLPVGAGDTAYEPDDAYYIQSFGTERRNHPPDLAIEIVVTHSEKKALLAGAFLKIPELWVLDIPRHRLTFHHLMTRGKSKGTYRPQDRSLAFPFLMSAEVLERLDDPEASNPAFLRNCRAWAENVLLPRYREGTS